MSRQFSLESLKVVGLTLVRYKIEVTRSHAFSRVGISRFPVLVLASIQWTRSLSRTHTYIRLFDK